MNPYLIGTAIVFVGGYHVLKNIECGTHDTDTELKNKERRRKRLHEQRRASLKEKRKK